MKHRKNKLKILLIPVFLLLLTACQTEHSSASNGCGVLYYYDKEYQKKAKIQVDKLRTMKDFKESSEMFEHYGMTRKSIRTCQKNRQSSTKLY